MNNLVKLLCGIEELPAYPGERNWAYVNRRGHVIHCTKAQMRSYFKKKKAISHKDVMAKAVRNLFAPCSFYKYLKIREAKKNDIRVQKNER